MTRWTDSAMRYHRDALPPEQADMVRRARATACRSFCYWGTALAVLLALLHWNGVGLQ